MPYPFSCAVRSTSGGYVYPPSGTCIYCGAIDGLTTEHIVPFGLQGDLILPEASCEKCRNITSGVETFVLQRMLGHHRRKFGYRSRSNKSRRNALEAFLTRHEEDGTETRIELSPDDLPLWSFALPIFGHPMLVGLGTEKEQCAGDTLLTSVSTIDAETALALSGGERPVSVPEMPYDSGKFIRFIAKIAHSYAIAALGRDAFEPILTTLIREGHQTPRVFVGGIPEVEPPEAEAFHIRLGITKRYDGVKFLAAQIRLLSYLGTPTYIAIVGQGFNDSLSAIEHCSYAKPIKVTIVGGDGEPIHTIGL